tara:strand:+ start:3147 stop:3449 length:303 start_codon:yes stop_codon:yes gene_type:complete
MNKEEKLNLPISELLNMLIENDRLIKRVQALEERSAPDSLLTIKEAARLLGMGVGSVKKIENEGHLIDISPDYKIRYSLKDVQKYIQFLKRKQKKEELNA